MTIDKYHMPQELGARATRRFHAMAKPGQRIENDLQTNGVLLNEDWARFLKEHRFLVGLSIDGPRDLHDRFRVSKGGAPTFDQVVAAAKLLKRFGVPFNTLTCVYRFNFCGKGVAVEHDGSVYSCDHYVYPEYRLGNLRERPLAEMVFSPAQVKFGYAKSETLPRYCRECAYLRDCWGECPKNRLIRAPDGEPGLNYLCAGFKRFFHHALPTVDRIAAELRKDPGL
jgi:radical SAM protein with 4Fe4S-binding SPASM domain